MRRKLVAIILPIACTGLALFGLIVHAAFDNHILQLSAESALAHVVSVSRSGAASIPATSGTPETVDADVYTELLVDTGHHPWQVLSNPDVQGQDATLDTGVVALAFAGNRATQAVSGTVAVNGRRWAWAIDQHPHPERSRFAYRAIAAQALEPLSVPFLIAALVILWLALWIALGVGQLVEEARAQALALAAARDEAMSATRQKSAFIATVSHEIRTPLNGVVGFAQLLAQCTLQEPARGYSERVHKSGLALLEIVNNVLDISKLEAGQTELEIAPVNARELLEECRVMLEASAASKGISLSMQVACTVPHMLLLDSTRIKQITLNIAGNAIKFTDSGSVDVAYQYVPSDVGKPRFVISVGDTGIGIAPENLSKLFREFTQADNSITRRYGGTGLGLSITKGLVDLMNGTIRVNSRLGEGSQFEISIPVDIASTPSHLPQDKIKAQIAIPAAADPQLETLDGLSILVGEDNLVNQVLIEEVLTGLGAQITIAADGQQIIDEFNANQYDLILMDCNMPRKSGLDATREIRALEDAKIRGDGARPVPIVALTATSAEHIRRDCELAGMNDFLTKPFTVSMLVQVIRRSISERAPIPSAANA